MHSPCILEGCHYVTNVLMRVKREAVLSSSSMEAGWAHKTQKIPFPFPQET